MRFRALTKAGDYAAAIALLRQPVSALPTSVGAETIEAAYKRGWNDCENEFLGRAADILPPGSVSLVQSQGTGEPVAWTDEQVERAARAHDEEDAAQKGEPSPWTHFNCSTGAEFEGDCPDCRSFRFERLAAMRKGLEALAAAPAQPQGGADHGR